MVNRVFLVAIIILSSLCSISYEVILARYVSIIIDNEVLGQSFTIAIFLLGMGLGSLRIKANHQSLKDLLKLEVLIASLASLTPLMILGIITLLDANFLLRKENLTSYRYDMVFIFIESFVLALGFLTGMELPLFLNIFKSNKDLNIENKLKTESILFLNYFGSLLSVIFVLIFLDGGINSLLQIIYFSIYNSLIILFLLFIIRSKSILTNSIILIPLIIQLISIINFPSFYNLYKKTYYFSLKFNHQSPNTIRNFINVSNKFGKVESIQTKYQEIDLVSSSPLKGMLYGYEYSLYLDRRPQFSVNNTTVYHQSFAHAPFHLTNTHPKEVLVLGGGDGILAKELIRRDHIKNIKIVELDGKILSLSKSNPQLLLANSNSLANRKVKIEINNALSFVKKLNPNSQKAIFIDFPYPNNFELLKLFSYEFYRSIYRILDSNGFVILDAPIISKEFPKVDEKDFLQVIYNTTRKSGFKTFFAFGTSEPFIILKKEKSPLKFRYHELPEYFDKNVFTNLIDYQKIINYLSYNPDNINSIFKPGIFNEE